MWMDFEESITFFISTVEAQKEEKDFALEPMVEELKK